MPAVFSNNASAPLAASITASATTITVTTAQGALFPAVPAGSFFYATIVDSSNNIEVVKATARSGDVLTVVRAQEGTTARTFAAADKIELRVTAASLNNMAQLDAAQTFTAAQTFSAGGALAGTFTGNPTFSGNPVFSGTPNFSGAATATTAAPGTNTTQIATTAFVQAAVTSKAASSVLISTGTGLSGGGDLSADRTLSIANTGVTATSYGGANAIPVLTINAQGQVTSASTAASYPTSYSLATSDGSSASRSVYLTAGTWQVVLDTRAATGDPSNYDFYTTQSGSVGSTTVSNSIHFNRGGGAGYGRIIHGSQLAVGSLTVSSAGNYTLAMAAVTLNFGGAFSEGSRIMIEKTA